MRYGFLGLTISIAAMILLMGQGSAAEDTTVDLTLAPGDKDGAPLIAFETGTIEIKVTSDIPVDIYILKGDQTTDAFLGDDFEYEEKWGARTSLDVDYEIQDFTIQHSLLVHNTDESETATVTLEYKLYEEIIDGMVEDEIEDVACGSIMILGIAGIVGIMIIAVVIRSKRE